MTSTDLDAEIVKAAEAFAVDEQARGSFVSIPAKRLIMAIDAKRKAMAPQLSPYHEIIRAAQNAPPVQNADCEIIDQTRADVMRVIEALPVTESYFEGAGGEKEGPYRKLVDLAAIRSALNQGRP